MTEKPAVPATPEVSSDDRLWAMLSFLIPVLIPLIILISEDKKERPFLKFHTVPALIFGIVEGIIMGIIALIPFVGCFTPLVYIINVVWGIKANKGEKVEIPVITEFAKNQGWI